MYALATINPFYAARFSQRAATPQPTRQRTVYARLPLAPITASPVPELTSLYHNSLAGDYGDRRLSRQLRRQPDTRSAAVFPASHCAGPNDRLRHVPRRMQGARHLLLVE